MQNVMRIMEMPSGTAIGGGSWANIIIALGIRINKACARLLNCSVGVLGACAAMLCMRLAAQSVSGFACLPDSVLEGDSDWGMALISESELRGRFQVRQLRLT